MPYMNLLEYVDRENGERQISTCIGSQGFSNAVNVGFKHPVCQIIVSGKEAHVWALHTQSPLLRNAAIQHSTEPNPYK